MRHPSLASIEWQDLRQLSLSETVYNIFLSLPFLLLSWWSAWQGWWLLALVATFFFFTAALRQAHDCYHRTLGVGRLATEIMLFFLSITMLCSTHAIRHTHLNHHRDPLGDSDVEGNWARLPWYQAILGGGIFSIAIQWFGLTHGSRRNRILVACDMLLIFAVIAAAFITMHPVLIYHVVVMILANTMVGFFAVWSVHHGCDDVVYARSERHPLINLLTFNLLYHIEHHLFPAVPTNHLPKLAKRLDTAAPQWTQQPVIPFLAPVNKYQKPSVINKTNSLDAEVSLIKES
ncbi:fatty acid desaturase family protein [Psychrobacter glaciei]|uniref:fatty acid desaturase family protein n=1 Tax=Psychrobacter glaciei TaxID=619771 RepID=UPI001F059E00|nr:fatty acid desaturase [Psychrobacter glaciei]MCH1783165.1 fatty acid desaturase [Psychrobacter glaciei]